MIEAPKAQGDEEAQHDQDLRMVRKSLGSRGRRHYAWHLPVLPGRAERRTECNQGGRTMERPSLKVVTLQPRKGIPSDTAPITLAVEENMAGGTSAARIAAPAPAVPDELIQRIDRLQQLVLGFEKQLTDLTSSLDFTEARLNRCIRLAKTLATLAGVPE